MNQIWITINVNKDSTIFVNNKKTNDIDKIEVRNDLLVVATGKSVNIYYLDKILKNEHKKLDIYLSTEF